MGDSSHQTGRIAQNPREATIRELAGRQAGNVSRSQLLKTGLSSAAIGARVKAGALVVRYAGIYALPPPRMDPPALAAAAVLACGDAAVLSHSSAAYLWGFQPHWDPLPEVTLTAGDRRPRGIRVHRCQSFTRSDARRHWGVRVTSPARTILDVAPRLMAKALTRTVNDARLSRHLRLPALGEVIARNPYHPGAKLLRPLVENPTGPTRSAMEDEFLAFVEAYGLPTPLVNVTVNGFEVDVLFPEHKVIVELDGWDTHRARSSFESDRDRDAEQLSHGFRTVRITIERMHGTPAREATRLHEILNQVC